jgi:arylsulfatase A-like enzyme
LREAGYETAGILSHVYVDSAHGFAQGFDSYDETNVLGHHEITSETVTDRAIGLLERAHRAPFFLFAHNFEPHYEYRDNETITYADDYSGWLAGEQLDIGGLRDRRHDLSTADLDYLRDLYDKVIAYTDGELGRILSFLKQSGLDRNTIVVVVADHGEEFMERGWLGHTTSLYEELVNVPFIIALPIGAQQEPLVSEPVETRSILPTVLDYVGAGGSVGARSGRIFRSMASRCARCGPWVSSHENRGGDRIDSSPETPRIGPERA